MILCAAKRITVKQIEKTQYWQKILFCLGLVWWTTGGYLDRKFAECGLRGPTRKTMVQYGDSDMKFSA